MRRFPYEKNSMTRIYNETSTTVIMTLLVLVALNVSLTSYTHYKIH